jgi:maltose alpha-D-glucosyltransferase/alpha-amylase
MLQEFVRNQGNAWDVTMQDLARYFERVIGLPDPKVRREEAHAWAFGRGDVPADVAEAIRSYLAMAEVLGRRTGELHAQLADAPPDNKVFAQEAYTADNLRATAASMMHDAERHLATLEAVSARLDDRRRALAEQVLEHRAELLHQIDDLRVLRHGGGRIRCHGDYHLGQVLVTEGDVAIIDFEGEPARPLAERREKSSPLRDVASMLRSFSYAALTSLHAATQTRPEDVERLAPWADFWETWVNAAFLRAYLAATRDTSFLPSQSDDIDVLLRVFLVDKALYELGYELNNRPDWVHIPLAGLLRLRAPLHA